MRYRVLAVMGALAVVIAVVLLVSGQEAGSAQAPSAAALHEEAIVVDGGVHFLNRVYWEGTDAWEEQTGGLWDFPRAKRGGLDVAVELVMVEDRFNRYNYAVKQAVRLIETFHRVLETHPDKMELALSSADVRRIVGSGKMAVILALEGGPDMEGDLDVLRLFYRLGVRQIQFGAHNTTNAYADAARDDKHWGGITEYGRTVIREMNRLGILIDIAHASDAAQLQIIEASEAPVVASHFGLRHFSDEARTMTDEVLQALAAKGGVVGIHGAARYMTQEFWDWSRSQRAGAPGTNPAAQTRTVGPLLRSPTEDYGEYIAAVDTRQRDGTRRGYSRPWREAQQELIDAGAPMPTVEDWTNQIDYAIKLVGGDDHVGIGLDFTSSAATLRDFDATSYPRFTESMVARSYSPARVRKVLGENFLRLFDRAKVPASTSSAQR